MNSFITLQLPLSVNTPVAGMFQVQEERIMLSPTVTWSPSRCLSTQINPHRGSFTNEADAKWASFRKRHFQAHPLGRFFLVMRLISQTFVPKGTSDYKPSLSRIMVWRFISHCLNPPGASSLNHISRVSCHKGRALFAGYHRYVIMPVVRANCDGICGSERTSGCGT